MTDLIPLLRQLCFAKHQFSGVPTGFAQAFVQIHAEDWRTAQDHWEQVVALVLNTDAVDPDATGREAISQAVSNAAVALDGVMSTRRSCPMCSHVPAVRARGERLERGRT